MMRPIENPKKRSWTRILAMILLICCVLTALPSWIFGQWMIKGGHDNVSGNTPVTNASPKYTVNFKYFAENMYASPQGETTYRFYQYDPTNAGNNHYCGAEITNGTVIEGEFPTLDTSGWASSAATVTKPSMSGISKTVAYCGCSGLSTCDEHNSSAQNASFDFPVYTISDYSFGNSVFSGANYGYGALLSVDPASVSSNLRSTTTATTKTPSNGTGTQTLQFPIADSTATLIVNVNYSLTVSISNVTSATGATCGKKHLPFLGSACTKKHTNYSATATISSTVTYTAYVRVESGATAKWNSAEITDGSANFVPYSITVNGSEPVILPSLETLKAAIPTTNSAVDETYTDAVWKAFYQGLMYPIGYYVADDYAGALAQKSAGKCIVFPMTGITKNTTIWIDWATDNPNNPKNGKTDLNASIKDGTNVTLAGQTISGGSDITKDVAYMANNSFGLTSPTVNGTLNLAFKFTDLSKNTISAVTNVNATEGGNPTTDYNARGNNGLTDTTPGLDAANVRDYTVVLQNDVTVNGALVVGGYTGTTGVSSGHVPHGYIMANYAALDLNGHTLTVNGELRSYGYIYDSVGTGSIVVNNGGRVYSQMLMYGWHGFNHTLKSFEMGFCPFEDYNLPYLRTEVVLKEGSTMYGYAMVFLQDTAGIESVYLKLFSNTNDSLFSFTSKSGDGTGYVTITSKEMEKLSGLASTCLNVKNVFAFHNVSIQFQPPVLTLNVVVATANLDLRRSIFPISPMVDLSVESSDFYLDQKVFAAPGSTVTFDQNSRLILGHSGGAVSFAKQGANVIIVNAEIVADSKWLSGGIYTMPYTLQSDSTQLVNGPKSGLAFGTYSGTFWSYFDRATVNIYGTLVFEEYATSNAAADPYAFSGNVNIAKFQLPGGAVQEWNEENLKRANFSNVRFQSYAAFAPIAASHTENKLEYLRHYYTIPVISFGKAYAVDQTNRIFGTYDYGNGILTANNGNQYVIMATLTKPSSTGIVDFAASIAQITNAVNETGTINGATYVYFAGTYSPATISGTTCTANLAKFASDNTLNSVALTWDATNSRWIRAT